MDELTDAEIAEVRVLLAERRAAKELISKMVESGGVGHLTKMVDPYEAGKRGGENG